MERSALLRYLFSDYDKLTKFIPNYDDNLYYDGRRYGETYYDAYYKSYGLKFENTIPYYLNFAKSSHVKEYKNVDTNVLYNFKKLKIYQIILYI